MHTRVSCTKRTTPCGPFALPRGAIHIEGAPYILGRLQKKQILFEKALLGVLLNTPVRVEVAMGQAEDPFAFLAGVIVDAVQGRFAALLAAHHQGLLLLKGALVT